MGGEVRNVQLSPERKCWTCKHSGRVSSPCPSRYNVVGKEQKKILDPVREVHEAPREAGKPRQAENHRPVRASEITFDHVKENTMGDWLSCSVSYEHTMITYRLPSAFVTGFGKFVVQQACSGKMVDRMEVPEARAIDSTGNRCYAG